MVGYKSGQFKCICLFTYKNECELGFVMPNFRGEKLPKHVLKYAQGGVIDNS